MKIVGVTACTIGIAHTYLAQQKLEDAAKAAGDDIKIETQGTIGIENALTAEDIKQADVVILAIDIKIADEERFKGKKVVKVSTETAIKSPNKLIAKLHEISGK
ncbi:PTS fructose transporter subunit IIB [Bifidobacterium sp. B4081]|uniref:PTS fructose transporter subunit IIB n=1 Tax=unclassified Bifidobacterium TaxID=2608897 RepID=UPI002269EA1A|nr:MULTISPECIES: PTS fructose transporter subunit IIB [unclassified Bifidobacterium]MCX8644826.1 PTS fructose transporter subunit IIB [Bifidobacterium sp. B4077]MCX8646640.1 PTS fructose transporter subunit IIB [Bifidobacterium sp. B4081]MCX8668045.1 PTS fructose transporter subunit IIB [Bifidobacterium sp. B3998]MCX8688118.1 PTS fructose transporter subunit IIB [Bifidobacterium sp. B4142]